MVSQLGRMRLHPFGRSEQHRLFAVPRAENNGALRLEALLHQLANRARLFEERDHGRDRILGAVHPPVVVVAAHHPLIGLLGPLDSRDHIVDGLEIPVERELEMDLRRAGTDVIRNRQRAAPFDRRHRTAKRGQQRLRVAVRDRQHRDLGQALRILPIETLRVGGGPDAWRERIARPRRGEVEHAAPLHTGRRSHRPLREHVVHEVAVVSRIRIDDAADRAVLGRHLRLDTAPGVPIPRDHDGALHRDAQPIEPLVILGEPVVHVDERRGDVAVHRVGVIGRQLLGFLPGRGIDGERGLLEAGHEPRRLHHLQHPLLRRRKEHGEGLDLRVPAGLQEPAQDPFRVLPAVGRADVMRPRREMAHRLAEAARVRNGAELRLPFPAASPSSRA